MTDEIIIDDCHVKTFFIRASEERRKKLEEWIKEDRKQQVYKNFCDHYRKIAEELNEIYKLTGAGNMQGCDEYGRSCDFLVVDGVMYDDWNEWYDIMANKYKIDKLNWPEETEIAFVKRVLEAKKKSQVDQTVLSVAQPVHSEEMSEA